jgi:hypothetical protein
MLLANYNKDNQFKDGERGGRSLRYGKGGKYM